MRTKANSPGGGAKQASKLLAAMAILAVAFVVLAAVPAALTDSDAADGTTVEVKADITADEAGCWKISSGTMTLEGNVVLNVTTAAKVADAVTKINLNGYNLKITGTAALTLGKVATIENGTGAKSVGTLIVAATDGKGSVEFTELASTSGITTPVSLVSGTLKATGAMQISGDLNVTGGVFDATTAGAKVEGDAVINGGTLNGDFEFLEVTMHKGTIDGSKGKTTQIALNGETVVYDGGTLTPGDGKAMINAVKSVTATFSDLEDGDLVLSIPTTNATEVSLTYGGQSFGADLTTTKDTTISYTTEDGFAISDGAAAVSGPITGTVVIDGTKATLGTGLIAVKGILDAREVITGDEAHGNIAVVSGGKLITGLTAADTMRQLTGAMIKDYGGRAVWIDGDDNDKEKDLNAELDKDSKAAVENLAFTDGEINKDVANLKTALFAAANAKEDIKEDKTATPAVTAVKYHTVDVSSTWENASAAAGDITVPSGVTLNLGKKTLTMDKGAVLTNEGTIASTGATVVNGTTENGKVFFQNNGGSVEKLTLQDLAVPTAGVTLSDVSGTFGVSFVSKNDTISAIAVSGSRIVGNDEKEVDDMALVQATTGPMTFGKISVEKNINLVKCLTKEANGDLVLKDVTVNSGASLKLAESVYTTVVEGTVSVYGDLSGYWQKDINGKTVLLEVPENQTFRMYNGSTLKNVTLQGKGTIDVSQAQRISEQGQDIGADKTFGTLEYVEIIGSLRVWNNSDITVLGGFAVDEGVTFTIEKGSKVTIDSNTAEMKIAGNLVVEDGAEFIVSNAKSIDITGNVVSEGTLQFGTTDKKIITTIKSGGSVTSADGDDSEITVSQLVIENGGLLTVESDMTITDVTNKGSIVLDGANMKATSTIAMAADGASVDIQGVSGQFLLTITDKDLAFSSTSTVADSKANIVSFTPNADTTVKGLTVTEKATASTSTNKFELSGDVSQTTDGDKLLKQEITVNGQKGVTIPGEMELGKLIYMKLFGNVSVSGTLETTVSASSDASVVSVESGAVVDVSGLIQSEKQIKPSGTLNAAEYQYEIGSADVYRYSTLAKALEDGATDINVLGTIYVTTDLTIPSGTTVKGNKVVVGSTTNRDITLTVEDGGSMRNATTDVYATLYFENDKNKRTSVISDVSILGDVDGRYTNIYTALSNAQAGDVVTITRETPVELTSDITIKEGVTLDVPVTRSLKVVNPITITVNGTLKSDADIALADGLKFDTKASSTAPKAAAVTLGADGIVMIALPTDHSSYDSLYNLYKTAGAYFHMTDSVGEYYYITSVAYAASVITETTDIADSTGTKYGAFLFGNLVVGDVAFSGDSSKNVSVKYVDIDKTEMTASSITLSKATFVSDNTFTGTIAVGDSSAVLSKVTSLKATTTVSKTPFTLTVTTDDDNENSTATISTGTVAVASADEITVKSGATMNALTERSKVTEAVIEGTLDVAAGRAMDVTTLYVTGSVIAQPASGSLSAGDLNVDKLYVGVTEDDIGAAASVSGTVKVNDFAVVKEGSTISKETSDSFGKKYTEYYVESSKWITVYDATGKKAIDDITKAPVTNAYFGGVWLNADGKSATDKNAVVGADEFGKVYAEIDYEVYYVEIKADQGIGDLYLNGNIMAKGFKVNMTDSKSDYYYAYWATVKAGDYEVTCKLANGYSGTAVLKNTDGTTVSNNKFTASGTPDDEDGIELDFQLTGIAKSGYVQPAEEKDEDTGMGITDYLLIVLVILVVVLAVIVALRLMRS